MPFHHLVSGLHSAFSVARMISRVSQQDRNQVIIQPTGSGTNMGDDPTTVPYQSLSPGLNTQGYNKLKAKITARFQIFAGSLALFFGSLMLRIARAAIPFIIVGICGGVLFSVSGVIGSFSARRRGSCLIVTYLVMSVVCALIAGTTALFYTYILVIEAQIFAEYKDYRDVNILENSHMFFASQILVTIALYMEIIAAITASGLACCGLSCNRVENPNSTLVTLNI